MLWALRSSGHDVRVVVPAFFVSTVLQAGLPAIATAPASEDRALDVRDDIDDDHTTGTYRRIARIADAMADDVDRIVDGWRPHLVISDPMDFTGRRAASEHGLAHAEHWIGGFLPTEPRTKAARHVFGARHKAWPGMGSVTSIMVDPCPPGFQSAAAPRGIRTRYVPYNGLSVVPPWLMDRARPRRVLITFGTVVSQGGEARRLFERTLEATAAQDVEVVIAARPGTVPQEVAQRAKAVQWLPVGLAAQNCDLIVHHGGSSTTMSALAHGVPQVVCPSMLDQKDNARRIEELGAGRLVSVETALTDGGELARAVQEVLRDPGYARSAEVLRDENNAAPPPDRAAAQLVRTWLKEENNCRH
ncbi:glycosyltransferase [Streptomyces canus]|uniref:glycosyltransferase n=1 Tax=Streptomyces canus TaxID=58343 RepID=UPI0038118E71